MRVGLKPWFGGKSEWFGGTFKWLEGKPQKKKPELKKSELFKQMMHQMPKGLNFTARFTETCIHESWERVKGFISDKAKRNTGLLRYRSMNMNVHGHEHAYEHAYRHAHANEHLTCPQ